MQKFTFLAYVLLALVLLLFGVVGVVDAQDVRYDFDKDKDFSKYRTYKWVPIKGADQVDELMAKQLTAALDQELAKKGLTKTDADTADRGGWYGYGGGMNTTTTYGSTSTIYIGQLDLSMYDSAQKQLVWRGKASKTLDPKAKPEKREKNIAKAVEKLLKNYPPPVKK